MDNFNKYLKVLDVDDDHNLSVLIDKYENTLKETLHWAACSTKTTNHNFSFSITMVQSGNCSKKRNRTKLERCWGVSWLGIDRQLYVRQCETVNAMIKNAKRTYYSSIIFNNAHNQKVLFSTVDKLLHRKPEKCYPSASSKTELVNKFADFFYKIVTIRK